MNKNLFKVLLSVLVLLIVLNVVIFKLYAIGAHNCTGTFYCDAIENACLEGEFMYYYQTATVCYGFWNCRSYFRVVCFDFDAGGIITIVVRIVIILQDLVNVPPGKIRYLYNFKGIGSSIRSSLSSR